MGDTPTRILRSLSAMFAVASGWALLLLSLLITFEVFARKLFLFSTQGTDEIGGYVLAISATAGFSYAFLHKAHVRIDLVLPLLPRGLQAALNMVALLLLNVFVWLLVWRAVWVTANSYEMQAVAPTPLATPLVLPQGVWTLALAFFGVVLLVRLVVVIRLAWRGDSAAVAAEFTEVGGEADAARAGPEAPPPRASH